MLKSQSQSQSQPKLFSTIQSRNGKNKKQKNIKKKQLMGLINILKIKQKENKEKFVDEDKEECYTASEVTLIIIIFCLFWGLGILIAYLNGKKKGNIEMGIYILLACPLNPFWIVVMLYHIGIIIGIRAKCEDRITDSFLIGNCNKSE